MNYVVSDSSLTSVADAIRAKGQTSAALEYPDGFVSAIDAIPTGGGTVSVPAKAVNFRDYDGTITNSYTKAEFLALSAMPVNPSHDGLTSQGWNWSFEDAQAYVTKYGRLEVGQMYITDDGKTRVYIHLEEGRTSPMLGVCVDGAVDVDWGDGTAHDTLTGTSTSSVKWTPTHHYAAPGDYVIKLTVTRGKMVFYGKSSSSQYSGLLRYTSGGDSRNEVYRNAIQRVEIGSGITNIGNYAFYYCYGLLSVTIPNSVTSIGTNVFNSCCSLLSITFPDSITIIDQSEFTKCYAFSIVTIPNSVTSIDADAFQSCRVLASITLPDSVTNIGNTSFYGCNSLSGFIIPDSVTNIESGTFSYCNGVAEFHLAPTTPPTLASTSAFSSIPADCVIYVPYSADHSILEAYKTAANWSTYASKMQEEPE